MFISVLFVIIVLRLHAFYNLRFFFNCSSTIFIIIINLLLMVVMCLSLYRNSLFNIIIELNFLVYLHHTRIIIIFVSKKRLLDIILLYLYCTLHCNGVDRVKAKRSTNFSIIL